MKKFLLAIIALAVSISVSAQVFVGGTLGLDVTHESQSGTSNTQTVFLITPEAGYSFNSTWAAGIQLGYGMVSDKIATLNVVKLMPFVRATFARAGIVDFFGELGAGYTYRSVDHYDASGFAMELRPGMAVNFTPKFALIARTNLLGFEHWDGKNAVDFGLNKGFDLGVTFKF